MAKIDYITPQKVQRIAYLAEEGKSQSVRTRYTRELNRIYSQYQRNANNRIRNLERAGYTYGEAYENARAYLELYQGGEARFHAPKTISGKASQLKVLSAVLRSPTSTIRYQKAKEAKAQKALDIIADTIHGRVDTYENARGTTPWRDARDFLRFIGSNEVQMIIDLAETSDEEIEKLYTIWEDDPEKIANIADRFGDYQKDPTQGMGARAVTEWIDTRYEEMSQRRRT